MTGNEQVHNYYDFDNEKTVLGLTIRQYFAAKAMVGLISGATKTHPNGSSIITSHPEYITELSCQFADALINELNKSEGK